jgi:hypothetical protein
MAYLNTTFCNRKDCKMYIICGKSVSAAEMAKRTLKRNGDTEPIVAEPFECDKYERW